MDQYLGEIRMFAGGFAPVGWLPCDGRILDISQYTTLYALIGTTYGGDGTRTFALPNLAGRWPVHVSPDLPLGAVGGSETVALTQAHLPRHSHVARASVASATTGSPRDAVWAAASGPAFADATAPPTTPLAPDAVEPAGGGAPHENRPPFTVVPYLIAVEGVFPPRD